VMLTIERFHSSFHFTSACAWTATSTTAFDGNSLALLEPNASLTVSSGLPRGRYTTRTSIPDWLLTMMRRFCGDGAAASCGAAVESMAQHSRPCGESENQVAPLAAGSTPIERLMPAT